MTAKNPSESPRIAIVAKEGCIGCEQCLAVCPADAIRMEDGIAVVDPELCTGCEKCVSICPASVISMSGGAPVEATPAAAAEAAPAAAPAVAAQPAPASAAHEVWVFVEHTDGRPAPVSWELLGKGKELADALGG
ncbi:MAG: 4Fe-4S dicluster domain-containing protein, partial [Armatimonadota bacterium]